METRNIQFTVLGDMNSGKSSIIQRFFNPSKSSIDASPTIGLEVISSMYRTDKTVYRTKFHDMSGDSHYDCLYSSYIFNSDTVIVVFDTTSKHSFERAKHWVKRVVSCNGEDSRICLLGNKIDLESTRTVHAPEVRKFIRENKAKNIMYNEVSALTGEGTVDAFRSLVNFATSTVREVYNSRDFNQPKKDKHRNLCNVM